MAIHTKSLTGDDLERVRGMCVAAALGITFPFNLALGIPLYAWWVERLVAGTS